jgi:peptide/nickel transport system substrate-binding protein
MGGTMKLSRRRRVFLIALLGFVLWVPACSTGKGNPVLDGTVPSATQNDINPVPRDQLADGGTLRWPLTQLPVNFNLHQFDGPDINTGAVMAALMPSVFVFDAAAAPILRTEYVESAVLTATSPRQVVTYRINPNAIWSDGTPITVADFEAQWRALNGTDPAFTVASTQGYDKIASVARGMDDREVVITFAASYADWRSLFSPLYPASTNADPSAFNDGWRDSPLTTAGPFRFESIDQTAKTITLVRDENWWGRAAKLERIIYRVIDTDAQVEALANGEIDFTDIGANVDALQRAQGIPNIAIRRAAGPDFVHVTMNGAGEVLADVEVRRALAMGIDRSRIAQALIGPFGLPTTPLGNHLLMTNQEGYQDNSGDLGRYDPERVRVLLDDAGWLLDGAVRAKDSNELVLRYVIRPQDRQVAELVQGMLREVGVEVRIEEVPAGDFFEQYIGPGNFDLTTFAWFGGPFPISAASSIYASPKSGADRRLDVQLNYARIGSPQLDRLLNQATAEFDPARAIQMANAIDEMIWQEVHSLPLYQRPDIVAARSDLANYGALGFANPTYEDIGFIEGLN